MHTYVEEELEEKQSRYAEPDTEITLGMKSLLGVFFGSVLICGVFFGFGYSLGRGNTHSQASTSSAASPAIAVQPATRVDESKTAADASQQSANDTPAAASGSEPKTVISDSSTEASSTPSNAASSAGDQQYEYVATSEGPARRPAGAPVKSKPHAGVIAPAMSMPASQTISQPMIQHPALVAEQPAAPPQAVPAMASAPRVASTGTIMVQVAAISRQEDANILVNALRKHGYSAILRNDPKDSLLHVQIGPFANRDDAKAMRAKLLGDGYNAIIK